MLRIRLTALTLALTSFLVGGCGSTHRAPARRVVDLDQLFNTLGGSSASESATKKRVVAFAHAVNLRAADAPGMISRIPEGEVIGPTLGGELAHCDGGLGPAIEVVGIESRSFHRPVHREGDRLTLLPIEGIRSEVYFLGGEALANQDTRTTSSAPARACLKHIRERGKPPQIEAEREVEVSVLPARLRGIKTYGLRVTNGSRTLGVGYEDIFGFAVGPFEVVLRAFGDPKPIGHITEQRLLSLLYSRAEAHRHS